jgi:tRNA nucleotidyltransferase (CCA-adding enzyme)
VPRHDEDVCAWLERRVLRIDARPAKIELLPLLERPHRAGVDGFAPSENHPRLADTKTRRGFVKRDTDLVVRQRQVACSIQQMRQLRRVRASEKEHRLGDNYIVRLDPLQQAIAIAQQVRDAGGRAFVVGGFVRDQLLGRSSDEVDLEVFGVSEGELRGLLERIGRVEAVGQQFAVYKMGNVDVALPRRESKTGRGHKAFMVTGDPTMSYEEAARRRDFTINAISWDPLTSEYVDPFNGRRDLVDRRLRVVDPRTFADDSLRVLRALQFAARFNLEADEGTKAICRAIPLDDLPAERIWGEFEKLLLRASRPSIGFALAREISVTERLLPEMHALIGCPQEPEWHPEGDVWIHTLMVIDEARTRNDDLDRARLAAIMLAAVCHDFGKPLTTALIDGRIRSLGHEEAGVEPATSLLDRLNVNSLDDFDVRHQVLAITAHHLKPGAFYKVRDELTDGAFRRLALKVDMELLARLAKADCCGRTGDFDCSAMDWFLEKSRVLGVEHEPPAPILMGRHLLGLGLEPGPQVGTILKAVYELQLDGAVSDLDTAIATARTIIQSAHDS